MEAPSNEANPKSIEDIMHMSTYFNKEVLVHSSHPLRYLSPPILNELQKDYIQKIDIERNISLSHVLSGDSLLICTTQDPSVYYFPGISRIIEYKILQSQDSSVGPIAIILVPTIIHAIHMGKLCISFLSNECVQNNGLVMAMDGDDNSEICSDIKKGCGILVATFALFELLLAQNVKDKLFDKSRLKHFIVDDMDVMSSFHYPKFIEIMSHLINLSLTESNGQKVIAPQFVITSQTYNEKIMPFLIRRTSRPLIIFKDLLEAAVYGGINFSISANGHYLGSKKDLLLLEIKKLVKLEQRTIVFCKNLCDVLEVRVVLVQNGIDSLIGKHINNEQEVNDWNSNLSRKILICTDNFSSLKIYNADNVIHYTYPDNWETFKMRHAVLVGNYRNMMNTDFMSVNDKKKNVVALTNEHDTIYLHRLIDLLIKQKQEVNPQVLELTKAQMHHFSLEYARQCFHVCPDLAVYGSCKMDHCIYNHIMGPEDLLTAEQRKYIPIYGILGIQIIQVFSTTHFAVRLLKWKESIRGEFQELPLTYNTLLNKLQLIYKDIASPLKYCLPKTGEICLGKVGSKYQRIRILNIPSSNKIANANSRIVYGQLIDENMKIQEFKISQLFVCPPEFQAVPPMVMHLYLSSILPYTSMPQNTTQVKTWLGLESQWNGKIRYEASIFKVLTHAIFASNLLVLTKKSINSVEKRMNYGVHLIKKGYGKFDANHYYRIQKIFFPYQD